MRIVWIVAVAWGLGGLAALPAAAAEIAPSATRGKRLDCSVERIVDGDTLVARCGGESQRVRLLRINTPERGRPGYREATDALAVLVGKGTIALEFEKDAVQRDSFGRLLAYVYRGEELANLEMVRQGWSAFFTKYGEGRLLGEFGSAERQARAAHVGLWDAKRFAAPARAAQKPKPKVAADAGRCRARASCCRVCRASQACGNACIGLGDRCSEAPGCACSNVDVCP